MTSKTLFQWFDDEIANIAKKEKIEKRKNFKPRIT